METKPLETHRLVTDTQLQTPSSLRVSAPPVKLFVFQLHRYGLGRGRMNPAHRQINACQTLPGAGNQCSFSLREKVRMRGKKALFSELFSKNYNANNGPRIIDIAGPHGSSRHAATFAHRKNYTRGAFWNACCVFTRACP
jgi:hypothetical protein